MGKSPREGLSIDSFRILQPKGFVALDEWIRMHRLLSRRASHPTPVKQQWLTGCTNERCRVRRSIHIKLEMEPQKHWLGDQGYRSIFSEFQAVPWCFIANLSCSNPTHKAFPSSITGQHMLGTACVDQLCLFPESSTWHISLLFWLTSGINMLSIMRRLTKHTGLC